MPTAYPTLPDYYDPDWDPYTPPSGGVSYSYGTWRWRFGSFSPRRGWPSCGRIWNERLALFKDSSAYLSVVGSLNDFSERNELGEITADQAFSFTIKDANPIRGAIADKDLLIVTSAGMWALRPSNAAQGVGPNNYKVDPQSNEGMADGLPAEIDGRFLYIGKSRRKVVEAALDVQRDRQAPLDLSRYARHIGSKKASFQELVPQKDPARLVWARRKDGSLAVAAYVPEEQVLGWATRPMAQGVSVQTIAGIVDPAGEQDQIWLGVTYGGQWHVLRMAMVRQEGDEEDPVMLDMAAEFEGEPAATWGPVPWLAGKRVQVQAGGTDGMPSVAYGDIEVNGAGYFTLPNPHARGAVGLAYPCRFVPLPLGTGEGNVPLLSQKRRIGRVSLDVLEARGLWLVLSGRTETAVEQMQGDSPTEQGFRPDVGVRIKEDCGDYSRASDIAIERRLPFATTIRAIQTRVSP
ncbi:hypothetical protein S2M10_29330 [Sphingomonas sp. S2M10]|uniref:hypothetical protein n=1 Tax=Sphingomonas sp. S2M10 TaxID=2705010 RepID=UPI001456AF68|nr:hypothetical protein [Sphingomonas sp. S2M10]NLS27931.1 hypothetical protein [Sphingomonas sp. S2M10]